ncbi:endo-1,4-beta-xylanase [Hymenobacter terrenus]|uniref:endo-1,4-beta-xylanase n=1 Tax=Hymenobacter terrenus TaxID=1629124 RepID=UPI000698AAED|nr:endo-1,4-beta-xylanase [Hymenobacter terrenus]
MKYVRRAALLVLLLVVLAGGSLLYLQRSPAVLPSAPGRWSAARANAWYAGQPWLFGANYIPATAINELEMWQAATFDPATIDKELGWAESLGINTLRVFLHDLPYQQDPEGFKQRIGQFLSICQKHHIRPMLVLFDSCWDPNPKPGKQPEPTPGVHNSAWVQSPGATALQDTTQYRRLQAYVTGIVGAFRDDERVLLWDVWNEPSNINYVSYRMREPAEKVRLVINLLPRVFQWARQARPSQPLTSGPYEYGLTNWQEPLRARRMEQIQLANSDVITFHNYSDQQAFTKRLTELQQLGRPVMCTEFMARGAASRFETHLPVAKQANVGMYCWGFVAGRTQTYLPWDSWEKPYVNGRQPTVWFHEILRPDGSPYRPAEVALIKQLTQPASAPAQAQR